MSTAGVVLALAPDRGRRLPRGQGSRGSSLVGPVGPSGPAEQARSALEAGLDEVVVVLAEEGEAAGMPEGATLLLDDARRPDEASALRVAIDWCARAGHELVVSALSGARGADPAAWRALAEAEGRPVLVGRDRRGPIGLVRLEATVWALLPLEGRVEVLWTSRPELSGELLVEPAERSR